VRTGEARLFWDAEVSADVLLASACLPQIFPPVDIEGESYWDGGYASNPPLRPLIVSAEKKPFFLVAARPDGMSGARGASG
jgi:NTE family protein